MIRMTILTTTIGTQIHTNTLIHVPTYVDSLKAYNVYTYTLYSNLESLKVDGHMCA